MHIFSQTTYQIITDYSVKV